MALTELRIASRRSQLAMVQTNWVKAELEKAHPGLTITVEAMATQGDKILDVALAKIGDKGLFTKELEAQMLVGRADIAVHSLKDLPTNLPEGLMLGCITEREDPADALVLHAKNKHLNLATLPEGAVVGTSSLRRLAQLRHHYPHLEFKDVRGNVITRLEKLDSGAYDCLILAAAGLGRLGFADRIDQSIPGDISLHAVGQGALGIECVENQPDVMEIIKVLEHGPTSQRCLAERAFLRELEGGCQVPIGVNTRFEGDQLILTGMVASLDGKRLIREQASGPSTDPESIGLELATTLKGLGAGEILKEIFDAVRPEA
ncbi:MAG: hydroxymethylbilane synthase [Parasynechococcus sp.]|jgi:hydroxymethylbilane synthase|uniref:hydroxymethylbilane synthase n=1 Tax=Parasynechococcus sp. TaxID=3101203 RepID=UPI000E19A93A|nr:hydroxymethylbilane synthase [Synechococcus sp. AH-551-C10]MBL6792066.1 hydroxymethylbilane synthase [Synechococcus sp. BS307-5m-G35]MDA7434816.1 hydroxymethylbilane synthase [Synechococcus sp. AH-601-J22]MDA7677519.1 hydroxymethylbilane synthase [bacterium]RCL59496.1 MAG: hydroxymethylbilane synthase [Synechococcus sp. MED-G69]MDB4659708.1 hydroxymethylbilane synthase [Synechococcus sp. AH-551-C10]|tara:strand:+ start:1286 stop:2239 length:954 start_codon:yes stop_codon:yes gene_type:complete